VEKDEKEKQKLTQRIQIWCSVGKLKLQK